MAIKTITNTNNYINCKDMVKPIIFQTNFKNHALNLMYPNNNYINLPIFTIHSISSQFPSHINPLITCKFMFNHENQNPRKYPHYQEFQNSSNSFFIVLLINTTFIKNYSSPFLVFCTALHPSFFKFYYYVTC